VVQSAILPREPSIATPCQARRVGGNIASNPGVSQTEDWYILDMNEKTITFNGLNLPHILYGTAWKENETGRLTELALDQGFRGIDTANQRKHYHEAAVGQAISAVIDRGLVPRDDLFLQTKFTFRRGQDARLPYDPNAAIAVQVEQSFDRSLHHLQTERIDSYLLHGPTQSVGLTTDDWHAWQAMESIHASGRVGILGVSNFTLAQLQLLRDNSTVRPSVVQNRCYAIRAWDRDIREFCDANDMLYQGFSLLTANQNALARPEFTRIAQRHNRTVQQIAFRFAIDVGMLPLTGTSSPEHMEADLSVLDFRLDVAEVSRIEQLARQ